MSEQKLAVVEKQIEALSLEISKLKDRNAELSLREEPQIPQQRYDIETELRKKEDTMRSLQEMKRGLLLRLKKLPELKAKIQQMEKRAEELNKRGLKALKTLEKHRKKVKEDVDDLREIAREFHLLQSLANKIRIEVDPEEAPNIRTKKDFTPPTNAIYFAENRGIVARW